MTATSPGSERAFPRWRSWPPMLSFRSRSMDSDLRMPGTWPGYDLACLQCGSGVRAIDRFCSQCGREDPAGGTEDLLTSPTIIVEGGSEIIEPTFVSTGSAVFDEPPE